MILSIIFDVANFTTFSLKLKYKHVNNTYSYIFCRIYFAFKFVLSLFNFFLIDSYFESVNFMISSANQIIKLIYYISQIFILIWRKS